MHTVAGMGQKSVCLYRCQILENDQEIKAIRQEDYTDFRGKKRHVQVMPDFSDSDSDF